MDDVPLTREVRPKGKNEGVMKTTMVASFSTGFYILTHLEKSRRIEEISTHRIWNEKPKQPLPKRL